MTDAPPPGFISGLSGNLRGLLYMFGAVMIISVMHVTVRYVSAELHPFEIVFMRSFFGLIAIAPILARQGRSALRTSRPGLQAVRGMIGICALTTWFYSLSLMPVGDATALSFTAIIFTTIGAIVVLKERVGIRRWMAIFVGLAGTLIILRPGLQVIAPGALLVLVSTVLWASSLICVKVLTRTESSVTVVFYSLIYFTVFSAIPAAMVWQWPTMPQLGWLVLIGVLSTLGHLCLTQSLKEAEAGVVMPMDYLRLIWAAGIGFLVFGEFPDIWTWVGGGVIFASTIYITYREARTKQAVVAGETLKARDGH
jgi:drug/metabolite transporter (DMT)-like permease